MLSGFILTVVGVAMGLLLYTVLVLALMLNPKVMKMYMKYMMKMMESMTNMSFEEEKENKDIDGNVVEFKSRD